jgi:hypothetical protein
MVVVVAERDVIAMVLLVCFVHPAVLTEIIGLECSLVKPKASALVLYYYQYVSRKATMG